jgi:hypothetical protein
LKRAKERDQVKTFVDKLIFNPMSKVCREFLGERVVEYEAGSPFE